MKKWRLFEIQILKIVAEKCKKIDFLNNWWGYQNQLRQFFPLLKAYGGENPKRAPYNNSDLNYVGWYSLFMQNHLSVAIISRKTTQIEILAPSQLSKCIKNKI